MTSPSYKYELDQKKIELLGVNLADVYGALQVHFGGMQVDYYDNRFGRTYKVVMQSDVYFRGEVDMLKFMFVKGSGGQFVLLDTLISYMLNTGTTQITRFNGKRSVLIQAQPAEGCSSGQAMQALTTVVSEVAPTGVFGALLSEFVLNYYTNTFGVGNPGFQNSIYMQIGVVMIMGLAAKNAILIIEFAKVCTFEFINGSIHCAP